MYVTIVYIFIVSYYEFWFVKRRQIRIKKIEIFRTSRWNVVVIIIFDNVLKVEKFWWFWWIELWRIFDNIIIDNDVNDTLNLSVQLICYIVFVIIKRKLKFKKLIINVFFNNDSRYIIQSTSKCFRFRFDREKCWNKYFRREILWRRCNNKRNKVFQYNFDDMYKRAYVTTKSWVIYNSTRNVFQFNKFDRFNSLNKITRILFEFCKTWINWRNTFYCLSCVNRY